MLRTVPGLRKVILGCVKEKLALGRAWLCESYGGSRANDLAEIWDSTLAGAFQSKQTSCMNFDPVCEKSC